MTNGEAAVYTDEFDVGKLQGSYDTAIADLHGYFNRCENAGNDRNNHWAGKSRDRRKSGPAAFPWEGASDQEAFVIEDKISAFVAICVNAVFRSHIRAFPVESGDTARATVISSFLKWMISSMIPGFKTQVEIAANHLFEKGIAITYVGWDRQDRTFLQNLSMEQIAASAPEFAEIVADEQNDVLVLELLRQTYPKLTDRRGKKALRELRRTGTAELPVSRPQVNRPCVDTLDPDGEFIFPSYTLNPQDAPYCFRRVWMTPQQVLSEMNSSGWDKAWCEEVSQNYRGDGGLILASDRISVGVGEAVADRNEDLIEVIHSYERLIDKEDGSEGIYYTVFHPRYKPTTGQAHAKRELMNGSEEFPVVVTSFSNARKRLYDTQSFVEFLRGFQWGVKVERDSRTDRNSLATVPPFTHPIGRKPQKWRPGHGIPVSRPGEITWMPAPPFNPGSVEIEQTLLAQADALIGLAADRPESAAKMQFYVDKLLCHVRDVIKQAFKSFQRYGPDEVFFRVTGNPDPQKFQKGDPDEDFDIIVSFDTQGADAESSEKKLGALAGLIPYDHNGRIDMDKVLEFGFAVIDPNLADFVLRPVDEASKEMVGDITDDLTKIYAGVEVGARPQGAQVAMQVIQTYVQQPDIAERLQNDEAFAERFQKYAGQYQFMLTQQQNAQIGRLGTTPADFQGTNNG